MEPTEVKYCPECKEPYIGTFARNHSKCVDCEVDLVDSVRFEEIEAEEAEESETE